MAPGVTGVWGWVGEQYSRHLERMGSLECGGGGVRGEQYSRQLERMGSLGCGGGGVGGGG